MLHRLFAWVALMLLATTIAAAATPSGPLNIVHQFIDGFNRGDTKAALAACASPAAILDEFPPHRWFGPTACADWSRDLDAENRRTGVTEGIVTLGTPWHVDISGGYAYVVIPATYAYKLRRASVVERGSVFTVALAKERAGWRITAWAWAKR